MDAYTLCSSSSSLLSFALLPFSFSFFPFFFSPSFGGFGYLVIRYSTDPHLKHFRGGRSEFLFDEAPAERAFSLSFLIFLKHFLTEWLVNQQNVHFALAEFDFSLCLLDPDWLLSRFKYSVCIEEMFKHFWSGYIYSLLNSAWWLANWAEYFPLCRKLSRKVCIIWYSE